jgi:hypothetical protein
MKSFDNLLLTYNYRRLARMLELFSIRKFVAATFHTMFRHVEESHLRRNNFSKVLSV